MTFNIDMLNVNVVIPVAFLNADFKKKNCGIVSHSSFSF